MVVAGGRKDRLSNNCIIEAYVIIQYFINLRLVINNINNLFALDNIFVIIVQAVY